MPARPRQIVTGPGQAGSPEGLLGGSLALPPWFGMCRMRKVNQGQPVATNAIGRFALQNSEKLFDIQRATWVCWQTKDATGLWCQHFQFAPELTQPICTPLLSRRGCKPDRNSAEWRKAVSRQICPAHFDKARRRWGDVNYCEFTR